MTLGPENFGNGAAKTEDRLAGQLGGYRPRGSRDGRDNHGNLSGNLNGDMGADDLAPRNGSPLTAPLDLANPIASGLTAPKLAEPAFPAEHSFSSAAVYPAEPAFSGAPAYPTPHSLDGWLDAAGNSVVDHPLLRGLLLELPPKGASLSGDWLDRWFEAARSILELLYSFEGGAKRP